MVWPLGCEPVPCSSEPVAPGLGRGGRTLVKASKAFVKEPMLLPACIHLIGALSANKVSRHELRRETLTQLQAWNTWGGSVSVARQTVRRRQRDRTCFQ